MGRREDFRRILRHEQPERILVDFGGNPLSSMEGSSMDRLLGYLGYDIPQNAGILPFGKVRRLDERILTHFDIDTRSVGAILRPQRSQYQEVSATEYIDEWGIRRKYTGMYWDAVDSPLRGATVGDLDTFEWPDPASIDRNEIKEYTGQARRLYEETDYVICAEHPVYGIFELGCWMCGFDDFLLKMAMDEEFVHSFFEIVLNYQKKLLRIITMRWEGISITPPAETTSPLRPACLCHRPCFEGSSVRISRKGSPIRRVSRMRPICTTPVEAFTLSSAT